MVHSISVQHLLAVSPANSNPFLSLHNGLHREFYGTPDHGVSVSSYVLLGVFGVALIGSIAALGIRIAAGNFWVYKLRPTGQGTLIVPNTLVNYLLYNIVFCVIVFPYVLLACLRFKPDLHNLPYWMCFTFLSLFFGVWHVSWATSFSATLSVSHWQTTKGETSSGFPLPTAFYNFFFISVLVAAPCSLIPAAAHAVKRYNAGFEAFQMLDAQLLKSASLSTSSPSIAEGSAMIVEAIPEAQALVNIMVKNLWGFCFPWYVCAALAGLAGLVMAIASFYQARVLWGELRQLTDSQGEEEKTAVNEDPAATSMRKVFRNIVLLSVVICISMWTYFVVCFVANLRYKHTKMFHMASSNRVHSALILYIYGALDCIIVTIILVSGRNNTPPTRAIKSPLLKDLSQDETSTKSPRQAVMEFFVPTKNDMEFPESVDCRDSPFSQTQSFTSSQWEGEGELQSAPPYQHRNSSTTMFAN